jgi:hypothetical protein
MKRFHFILAAAFFLLNTSTDQTFIDPTGTYELISTAKVEDGDTYGYFGEICVKLIDKNKIAMSFYICKGAPGYNSGSFVDTLEYRNNIATYKDKYTTEQACRVEFTFSRTRIKLKETANYEYGNCWGNGVVAFGSFKKISSKIPAIKNPMRDD